MRGPIAAAGDRISERLRSMISDESYREGGTRKREYSGENAAVAAGLAAQERIAENLPNSWWQLLCDATAERLKELDPFGGKRRRRRARARDDFYAAAFSSNDPNVSVETNRRRQAAYQHEEQIGLAKWNFWWLLLFAFFGIVLTIVNILLMHF